MERPGTGVVRAQLVAPLLGEAERRDAAASVLRIPCEVYSRIVGYLRPVQNWHRGKQQEFKERRMFRLPEGQEGE